MLMKINNQMNIFKKYIVATIIMISLFSLVACSRKDDGGSQDKEDGYAFSESFSVAEGRKACDTNCIYVRDEKMYYVTEGEYDESRGMPDLYLNMCDMPNGSVTELFQLMTDDDNSVEDGAHKSVWIEALSADDTGNISAVVRSNVTDDMGEEIECTLKKYIYSPDGKRQEVFDIDIDISRWDEQGMIKSCRLGNNGDIYILYEIFDNERATLYKFNPDGSAASSFELKEMTAADMVLDADDRPIVMCDTETDSYSFTSAVYIDMDKAAQGVKLDGIVNGTDDIYRRFSMYSGGDGAFILNDGKTLSIYDSPSATESAVCDWIDCGLLGSHVIFAAKCKNGNIFCLYNDGDVPGDLENVVAGFIEKRDLSEDDRTVIKVADWYDSNELQQLIIRLNRDNENYRVKYISYGQYGDGIEKMKYDIISGNVPDVIILDEAMGINNFIAKGFLEDLTPYVEKDDTVNEDYFIDGFLDAISIDGKNYFLSNNFCINVLAGKKSDLSEFQDGWSVDEFIEYYKSKPEGTKIFANTTKQGLCFELLGRNMSKFIDWDGGKCSFDSDEFRKLLEFCAGFENGDMFMDDELSDHVQPIKEGKLLLEKTLIRSSADVNIYRSVFGGDEMFIGYPSDEDNGIYIESGGYGIMSSSEHKDEAWDFIKKVITDESSENNASKDGFEKLFAEESAPHEGTHIYSGLVAEPAKREDADLLKELVKKANYNPYIFEQYEIIQGDIDSYFAGEKGLDETIKVIQDRMEKYVNENR